ncbi:hypothetical protein ACHQM5_015485 [Ranunculus cassubicifolius]
MLTSTQRYAAGGLFAIALHQAQIHQTRLGSSILPTDEDFTQNHVPNRSVNCDSITQDSQLWIHENSSLLRPILRVLEIDEKAWHGIEETGGTSSAKEHIGAFLRLISEDRDENSSELMDKEVALTKAIDAMVMSLQTATTSESRRETESKYENECREKHCISKSQLSSEEVDMPSETLPHTDYKISSEGKTHNECGSKFDKEPVEESTMLSYEKKVVLLYELLSACLANASDDDDTKRSRRRQGYDARHRAALRLLATWLDVKWMNMEAMEVIVACSAMALLKKEEEHDEEIKSQESSWSGWKRGSIIGAAALTGGTLMAVTGGLAAPAIASGFSALAPTLGTLVPVIGASGFAAAASATGSVAGSIAVAASFGAAGAGLTGSKMAKRTADLEEFEFKAIGDNHNQGRLAVGIMVSGLIFEEEDFLRPWEGQDYNLERYAVQWETENLIALSTAIEDWLTSKIATGLMKQGAMMTVTSTLLTALALPSTLVTAAGFIDSRWAIAIDRSDKAGALLAEVLSKGLQGNRPVTLVGFSLGARVIFKCLQRLAETEDNAGLVERVVLLGAPVSFVGENWESVRKMVAGRFVNVFATNDWTLGIAFRASLLSNGLAGIQPVDVPGIENVDVTEFIDGHSSYLCMTGLILEQLQLDEFYPTFKGSPPKPNPQEEKIHSE